MKLIILSAPSGSGKTTIIRRLLTRFPKLEFSVSATSRQPRPGERDGVDYYFITPQEFAHKVSRGEFVEWEEVYAGTCYGTLRSELERIDKAGKTVIFDVDVVGGLRLKEIFGRDALAIFVQPPSIPELKKRLMYRGTDSPDVIEKRVEKAEQELSFAPKFDRVVVNDILEDAIDQVGEAIEKFTA